MSLREWLKQFLPMSSRSLNGRMDNLLIYMGEMEERLRTIEANSNELKKLSYNHLDPGLYAHAVKQWYQDTTGNILDLDNPKTYNEKIQWMKVYDRDPRKTLLADKYLVRDWVKEKIGEEYLIPLLAVYRSAREIDFNSLPDAFVLKANHGSGMNAIIRNKHSENLEAIRSRAEDWLRQNFTFSYGYEFQYNDIPRRLIAEQYLENMDGDMPDYKFFCFDGKCRFIEYIANRKNGGNTAIFDSQWKRLPFVIRPYKIIEDNIPMPQVLPDMINVAEKLAEGFSHVRVDLYRLDNDKIKFGEMTFTTSSGTTPWVPSEADLWVGEMFHLPEKNL